MSIFRKKKETDPYTSNDLFRRVASRTSHGVGSPWAFVGAASVVIIWACTGPIFHYSDTWQLVINTSTTIVTFLMVFLIQNTQNRDSHALHLKLDELIRSNVDARNGLMGLEDLTDRELQELQEEFNQLAKDKLAARSSGGDDLRAGHADHAEAHAADHADPQRGESNISSSTTGARSSRTM